MPGHAGLVHWICSGSRGRSEVRILFFDPWRSAILLVVGDKAGSWNKWYASMIPRQSRSADERQAVNANAPG
jgi:hypothetical protein